MDYCNQCRRHLNGALACAGCGTPVEELRYQSPVAPAVDHPVLELDEVSEPAGHRRARHQPSPRRKAAAGRRARKRRGRKVLLGTFGLVLAAGALSLAELAIEDQGDDGAATAVKDDSNVETEPAPEPTDVDVTPEGPDPVTETPVSASSSARPTATGTGGPGGGAGKPTATSGGGGRPSATPSAVQSSASAQPSNPGQPSGSASTQPPPQGDPPPTPTPTPCEKFLWFCV